MRFPLQSIRARLTFWYTFLVLSTLVAFGVISYFYSSEKLSESLDFSLGNEVRWIQNFIQPRSSKIKPSRRSIDALLTRKQSQNRPEVPDSLTAPADDAADQIWNQIYEHTLLSPKKTYIQVADKRGEILYRSYSLGEDSLTIPDSLGIETPFLSTIRLQGEPVRIAATLDKNFIILVGYPLAELQEVLENLFSIFLVLIPIAVGISVGGGLYLAHTSLRRVDEITRRARQITAENLDQMIPERRVNDEIGRLIATINDMIRRLHDSFAQIRQFSADASHELRTPLTIMRGEIELALRSSKTPEEYRQVLGSALEELLRMSTIMDNLLTLAKADQGLYEAHLTEVHLDDLLSELFDDSEILAEPKQIKVDLARKERLTIVGDKVKLRQLFLNLISNAIKYTPIGGNVSLAIERDNGTALFHVKDTGIGIPSQDLDKIFNRFYRVDKARSRELGGSGLGLSIAKWIAELHRGSITVQSELHKGSTFTVHLPIN
jgi:heavy metal sensor kinase